MKRITASLLAFTCLVFVGCDRLSSAGNGPVAIVDLDAVAQKLGRDKQIVQMIEERQVDLNQQVLAAQKSLIEQLNKKKVELGELSDEEVQQLSQLQNQANSMLATTKNQAQANLTGFQQEVVNRFREEAKPIALELAAKKGCRVILSKNDTVVFAFDKTVDLTDEVVAAMMAKTSSQISTKNSQPAVKHAATEQNANRKR
jgi:Skp family chaperone for outer membrane proteins